MGCEYKGMNSRFILTLGIAALATVGCDRKPQIIVTVPATPLPMPVARTATFETRALQKEIDAFDRDPSQTQFARVRKAFVEIDGEIEELVEHVAEKSGGAREEAARKLSDLLAYRTAEHNRFLRLESRTQLQDRGYATDIAATPTPRVERGAERLGEKIDDAARKVEGGLRDAADAIRDKTR